MNTGQGSGKGKGLMGAALQPGDRVRVRVGYDPHGYPLGDKGVIVRVAKPAAMRRCYYLVAMDKDGPDAAPVLFSEDEVEADA